MIRENTASFVQGTAALKIPERRIHGIRPQPPHVLGPEDIRTLTHCSHKETRRRETPGDWFWRIVASSEMACSLLTEDVRGCAYNKLTHADVAVCASAISLIALVSVLLGA